MKTQVIAEAGVNHNGDPELAFRLVDAAVEAGADAVKFQTFRPEEVVSSRAPKADYQLKSTGGDESQLEMARKLKLDDSVFVSLAAHCRDRGIAFLSTPFDHGSMDLLVDQLGLNILKLPSGEVTNGPFLLHAARTGTDLILSTGMSTLDEVRLALGVLAYGMTEPTAPPSPEAFAAAFESAAGKAALQAHVTLLHCTTEYPTPVEDINLRAMDTLSAAFGLPVGLSDHSPGITVAIAAAARDACIIEKHFTLDRTLPGPDHQASLEPAELAALVAAVRVTGVARGDGVKQPKASESKNIPIARRSLVARCAIARGEPFTAENLAVKRPGTGISPMRYWDFLGRTATRDYAADDLIDE